MEKIYHHQGIEEKWYRFWEEAGFFQPKKDTGKIPFSIIMPPPNANGSLHIGHAMFVTIEDLLIRYHRMLGDPTLWLPGADHAGILTQVVFERELAKQGKTRHDLGREEFFRQCYEFSQKNKEYMYHQLKRLGASCDWTREKFTLDPGIEKIVRQTFKKLYDDGLVYKGERIINWCPRCSTALSDLEVEYQEREDELYFLDYGPLQIATTRPETILADAAVAVHPADKRYKSLLDKEATVPLLNKKVPVIADQAVDMAFGTGALKITPGHDPLDWEIGQRHHLPTLVVIGPDGKMTAFSKKFEGLTVDKARERISAELKKEGKLIKTEPYEHNVSVCERCKTAIEPLVSKQWFIKMNYQLPITNYQLQKDLGVKKASLAELGILAVKKGLIKIIPQRFEKIYFQWLENLKDWCLSRQIWWGYKIPFENEEDTLDTWFSSGQWPFATLMSSPDKNDFKSFYPTAVMETGYEILFFWVARMIMLGLYATGQVPFRTVYLHGLVRDAFGQKMSKSKGNVIDPLTVADRYGADAVRFSLVFGTAAGQDLNLSEEKIRGMRNFTNKIWNAARFVLSSSLPATSHQRPATHPDDQWVLDELDKTIKKVTALIEKFKLGQAAEVLYEFFWHEFCDKYLEMSKKRRGEAQSTLLYVLENSLLLLHPFMPFISEEIWQKFKKEPLIISAWPIVK